MFSCSPNRKLSFMSLPAKPPPPDMATPPLRSSVSIPFRWEEAPGRPRKNDLNSKSVRRSLELPPRLMSPPRQYHSTITNMPSPTTVLDHASRSLSFRTKDRLGSRRWGSFRKTKGSFHFSSSDQYHGVGVSVSMRRRGTTSSHLWGGIYESLKQVVPWNRVRNKTSKY